MSRADIYNETNQAYKERYDLAIERLKEFKEGSEKFKYFSFFESISKIAIRLDKILMLSISDELKELTISELKSIHDDYYKEVSEANYEKSFCNPDFAAETYGKRMGGILSSLFSKFYNLVYDAYAGNLWMLLVHFELVIEIHGILSNAYVKNTFIKRTIYYFNHDYCYDFVRLRQRKLRSPKYNDIYSIVMDSDLSKPDYLYLYGAHIGENELGIRSHLASLPEDVTDSIAETFVSGYVRGFEMQGIDFSDRINVEIRFPLGFELVIRKAVKKFEAMGKHIIMCLEDTKVGTCGLPINRQFNYDHRNDNIFLYSKRYCEVYKEVYQKVCNELKDEMAIYAGPAVFEIFGEKSFKPVNKETVLVPGAEQKALDTELTRDVAAIMRKYIDMTKRSFTIISYPVPEIGDSFKEIFDATNKVNTLDNATYQKLQQNIIDLLDSGSHVHVHGRNGNKTDLVVQLHKLNNPEKETNFENCTADVNIPVGEVFTSPVLKGTNGLLHVKHAYLEGYEYKNLELRFENGEITGYSCENFDTEAENKTYIEENILFRHETLPIGEFAIGTNTTAYAMATKFNIWDKLPILIAEKTGPHFAVGDTCYSYMEDFMTYNPDGKAIIARDNEISALRTTEPEKAYFNCHTDITIPYDELDFIRAYTDKDDYHSIIENGRFVVPGSEILNLELAN